MADSKLPPGAKPGLGNTDDGVNSMKKGDPSKTGSGLDGHSQGDIGKVGKKRMKDAPVKKSGAAPRTEGPRD